MSFFEGLDGQYNFTNLLLFDIEEWWLNVVSIKVGKIWEIYFCIKNLI